ncbi:MAG: hypothetical protein GC156_02515 [Actinomycetales bacterium]|nr:hypothetical protein [Actinomycetales bacterium]
MTTPSSSSSAPLETPSYGRALLALNALVAWTAVVVSFTLNISGYYAGTYDLANPTILENVPGGDDTVFERFFDWTTYFTILSNITVAVVLTVLVMRPGLFTRRDGVGTLWRTLRLDSVLMITITGVVYNLLLAEGGLSGWGLISNTLLHWITPLVTPIVWIIAGPRGLIQGRIIPLSLVLPLIWATYALIRGQVIGAYPYPFLDVATKGLAYVLVFIAVIMVVAMILALILWAVDTGLRWTLRGRTAAEPVGEEA